MGRFRPLETLKHGTQAPKQASQQLARQQAPVGPVARKQKESLKPRGRQFVKTRFFYSTIIVGSEFLTHTKNEHKTKNDREDSTLTKQSAVINHEISDPDPGWLTAVRAAQNKKATDITVLDLTGITSFTDYFVICTGASSRQNQAIVDEIALQLKKAGDRPISVEGYEQGEWILSDYGDFLVHVFTAKSREYYSLERLWREAKSLPVPAE
jgi:ribosome-associated protein